MSRAVARRVPIVAIVLTMVVALLADGSPTAPSAAAVPQGTDALPSWNDGPSKNAIVSFVQKVTSQGSAEFIPEAERIAVFDNDGTLWSEQPIYFQFAFALSRVRALAPQHPEWKDEPPFKAILENDMKAFAASGEKGLMEVIAVTHSGMTTEEFEGVVRQWAETARHPKTGRLYTRRGR